MRVLGIVGIIVLTLGLLTAPSWAGKEPWLVTIGITIAAMAFTAVIYGLALLATAQA